MLDLSKLPVGTILNTYGQDYEPVWWKRQLFKLVKWRIRVHQRSLWRGSEHTDAIHSIIKVYDDGAAGLWLSVTVPRAVIETPYIDPDHKARAFWWEGMQYATPEGWQAFEDMAKSLEGKPYDIGQLIDIMLNRLFDKFTTHGWSLFDSGKKNTVCSAGCMACVYALWQFFPSGDNQEQPFAGRIFPKPNALKEGGYLDIERVSPAFFENEPRWVCIGEQNC